MATCAILSIGNELLLGHTVDTNAAYLCSRMTERGWRVVSVSTVGDNLAQIVDAISRAAASAEVVLMTGGLGPTPDDLTRDAIAAALGVGLEEKEELLEAIRERFRRMNWPMCDSNRLQARIPLGATALHNTCGTAPGVRAVLGKARLYSMPGVPPEMREMMRLSVLPEIEDFNTTTVMRRMHFFGAGESSFSGPIREAEKTYGARIGTTVQDAVVTVRVQADAPTLDDARRICQAASESIRCLFEDAWFGDDGETLASAVVRLLKEKNAMLALAESCTGGLIASSLIDVPGASDVLIESAVTYANAAKVRRLGVSEETLARCGAVSEETALEMARGAKREAGTDYALSATGIAGPGGGTEEKPVGLVWLALATPSGVYSASRRFAADRSGNRVRAVHAVLDMLRRFLTARPLIGATEHRG